MAAERSAGSRPYSARDCTGSCLAVFFMQKTAAIFPEVLQQKQQDIFGAYLQVRDNLKNVLKLFQSALFWVEKATAGGRRGVTVVKTEQK